MAVEMPMMEGLEKKRTEKFSGTVVDRRNGGKMFK